MADVYKASKGLADHINLVFAHLAAHIGSEPAALRVIEHIHIILQDALDGGSPEDMALVLKPPGSTLSHS